MNSRALESSATERDPATMTIASLAHPLLALVIGGCFILSITRMPNSKQNPPRFIIWLKFALGHFIFANIAVTVASLTTDPELDSSQNINANMFANCSLLFSQFLFDTSSLASLWVLLCVADTLFDVTRYTWPEPFTRPKVFSLAPFVSCVLLGLSAAYMMFGLLRLVSGSDTKEGDIGQEVIWQVMYSLVLAILNCMLTALGYVAYKRTQGRKDVHVAGILYLLALALFATRNVGNVLYDWHWGVLGTTQPSPMFVDLHEVFDIGLLAATLGVVTLLGVRQHEDLMAGGENPTGYTTVAADEQEMDNRA